MVNTMHRHIPGLAISIGYPTPNNSVYILDENLAPVPAGSPGIMWAGGAGVCKGYANRAELTRVLFKPDPYMGERFAATSHSDHLASFHPHGQNKITVKQQENII